ncbi:helix-turn-helix transcriptional regulator [Secundilactobacillus kimchicus]|uniref:helix-turn-helix transcriptional regulator n=1 Tax=Secundilactobacillus kimchicus TaxID=528209 RepID=UPI0006E1660B|nr:helix-turn-helix transcriptional regulator [Secundilactobacillus kimchicus]
MSFKDDLRMMRHQAGLTQEDLAQKLHVTRQTVSTWETGKNRPNLETLHTLSQLFNEPLEKLLFGEETKVDKVNRHSVAKKN